MIKVVPDTKLLGKFSPREIPYVKEYTKEVDITPWKYVKPVGLLFQL